MKVEENLNGRMLHVITLRYYNEKYENDYEEKFSKEKRGINIILMISFFLFSLGVLIWGITLQADVNVMTAKMKVELVGFDYAEFQPNYLNTANETREDYIYYDKYYMLNTTAVAGSKDYFIRQSETTNNIARKYLFIKRCFPLCLFSAIVHAILIILVRCVKSEIIQTILFCVIFGILGLNFHIISGVLRSFYQLSSDSIFFIVASQLFVKILIIMIGKTRWLAILITCLTTIVAEWILFLCVHVRNHESIIFYFLVSTSIHLATIMLSYYSELRCKKEFYFFTKMQFDNEYLINFIYNMDQGFATMDNNEVKFINKSMNKLIDDFEMLSKTHRKKGNDFMGEDIVNCPTLLPRVDTDLHLHSTPPIRSGALHPRQSINETIFININNGADDNEGRDFLINKNYASHVRCTSKGTIERIIENLTELNMNLPEEILNLFKMKNNADLSIMTNSFNIDLLYNTLKAQKDKFGDRNFTQLGVISFKKKCKSFEEEFGHGACQNSNDLILNRTYQVMFRIITHVNSNDYLELIFSDVSNLVLNEREKAIFNCRSIYLSKIAHEFKNPLISLMELSTDISEEVLESNKVGTKDRLLQMTDYILYICKTMNLFLKDFSLITETKIPCNKCIGFSLCSTCGLESLCSKCKICVSCEGQLHTTFDHKQILVEFCETFNTLSKHEQKNIILNLEFDSTDNIKTNHDLFYSVVYNLIYHCYKNTDRGEIFIKTGRNTTSVDSDSVFFEIKDSGLEVNQNFIKKLNQKLIIEDGSYYAEENCDKFNKYFNIYVAFCLVKKLGSTLKIESNERGTVYSFNLLKSNNNMLREREEIVNFTHLNSEGATTKISFKPKLSSIMKRKFSVLDTGRTVIFEEPIEFNYNKLAFENIKETEVCNINCLNPLNNTETNIDLISKSSLSISVDDVIVDLKLNLLKSETCQNIKRVLIVDDESLIRSTLKRFLKKIDESNDSFRIEIFEAGNCFNALDIIYKNYEDGKIQFDFVIIDEYMPHMKGSTLIRLLKQLYQENNFYNLTFISHTAFDTPEKKKFIMENGADYILSKPLQYNDFKDFFEGLVLRK